LPHPPYLPYAPHPPYLPYPPLPAPPAQRHRCTSHVLVGSVPAMNASLIRRGQNGVASLPVAGSISANEIPSGASNGTLARPASAAFMNCVQIGSAACAPLNPTGWLSSKPT